MKKRRILSWTLASLSLLTAGCSYIINEIDEGPNVITTSDSKPLSIVFSHNINGETHPCGCRHFPLGGLPQVAGRIHEISKTNHLLYVDTGDTFFPSSNLPDSVKSSKKFIGEELASSLKKIGLAFMVPGDQDFALGYDFLKEVQKKNQFDYIISNMNSEVLPHKKWALVKAQGHNLYFIGIVDPSILPSEYAKDFTPVKPSLKSMITFLKTKGYKEKDPTHKLILLSHSGFQTDEKLAEEFKELDWIIGAHSQSFFRDTRDVNKTRIVQVLSRNHYLGEINFDFTKGKKPTYKVHEMREEEGKLLKNNEFYGFLDAHKEKLQKIQIEEQNESFSKNHQVTKFSPAVSCRDCHNAQYDFWQKTPHSIAYGTLIKAKEHFNTDCVKCHTQGLFDERGFSRVQDVVTFDEGQENVDQKTKAYWAEVEKAFSNVDSIRALSKNNVKKIALKWESLDEKYKVTHNHANVQCLNCHDKHQEHPFTDAEVKLTKDARKAQMKNKCLSCHDPDQSPQWYDKDEKGLARKLKDKDFNQHFKKLSCPTME
ncbi:multiheme c-type cytochrome [Halobacteriovorax sp. GB3]|uniref:multiheme c-type cytochrome n=1 Tax=Halobacteriovorax sp. GB3 TaxID=2719615 RepID=UPI0023604495|nr:multiheme c-type cytochrome [Halobacteriovorax sp. GB3]MDD0851586.1 multiheme c-type cytochrome [Halobacteriovorax sp. GB3]